MSDYLNIPKQQLKQHNAYWTAKEIAQQPKAWSQTIDIVEQARATLNKFLKSIMSKNNSRIILTGAGTSAYVGLSIAPFLSQQLGRNVEAIATTDIVSNPEQYFAAQVPTLVISFARSGNSPESVAAVELANQLIDKCQHLIISCNDNSELIQFNEKNNNSLVLLMPEQTLDQSFAMTSSFSCMMLAALWLFCSDSRQLEKIITATEHLLSHQLEEIKQLAETQFNRIIYLGSGGLNGIAKEAALKMLELSAGQIDCYHESPLGFRHGPKSIVDDTSVIMLLNSHHSYRQPFENDLAQELLNDNKTQHVYSLNKQLSLEHVGIKDVWLSFPYIVYCQALAFYKSLALSVTPDNPCPSGEVNRVVQGVNIYPYQSN